MNRIRKETGAALYILPKDEVPICAFPNDRIIEITGNRDQTEICLDELLERIAGVPPTVIFVLHILFFHFIIRSSSVYCLCYLQIFIGCRGRQAKNP